MSGPKDALMFDEPYRYEHDQLMGDYVFKKGDRWNTHADFKLHTETLAYQEWHQK